MTHQAPQPAPGWYPTPDGPRFWDGYRWLLPLPPQPVGEKVASPVVGWLLVAVGASIAAGSFMDWATALGGLVSQTGTGGGDGFVTLVLGLLLASAGFAIGRKHGLIGLVIASVVGSVVALAFAIFEIQDVQSKAGISVGAGLWLILVAALGGIGVSLAGIFTRAHY